MRENGSALDVPSEPRRRDRGTYCIVVGTMVESLQFVRPLSWDHWVFGKN